MTAPELRTDALPTLTRDTRPQVTGTFVCMPRNYPQLSQTFVRNEVFALRELGNDVDVRPLDTRPDPSVPPGWGGPDRRIRRRPTREVLRDNAWWATRHPLRYLELWRRVAALRGDWLGLAVHTVPSLARELQAGGADACYTHFAWQGLYPVIYTSALLGVPAAATVHAADIYLPKPHLRRRLQQLDLLVTVCGYNVDFLREHDLVGPGGPEVVVVPCGVDLPAEEPAAGEAHRLVSVGRLVPKKGFDVLLRAMPAVLRDVPQAHLDIVGDGPLRAELEELAASLGVAGSVTFHGAKDHAASLGHIESAATFVLACRPDERGDTDALPVVLREAMARGRAVVSTTLAGIPESIDDTVGWLVPPQDDAALAAALVQVLSDPVARAARGAAARERVRERWTFPTVAAQMRDALLSARRR